MRVLVGLELHAAHQSCSPARRKIAAADLGEVRMRCGLPFFSTWSSRSAGEFLDLRELVNVGTVISPSCLAAATASLYSALRMMVSRRARGSRPALALFLDFLQVAGVELAVGDGLLHLFAQFGALLVASNQSLIPIVDSPSASMPSSSGRSRPSLGKSAQRVAPWERLLLQPVEIVLAELGDNGLDHEAAVGIAARPAGNIPGGSSRPWNCEAGTISVDGVAEDPDLRELRHHIPCGALLFRRVEKIAERYCVPTSLPAFNVVGSWIVKNVNRSSYEA